MSRSAEFLEWILRDPDAINQIGEAFDNDDSFRNLCRALRVDANVVSKLIKQKDSDVERVRTVLKMWCFVRNAIVHSPIFALSSSSLTTAASSRRSTCMPSATKKHRPPFAVESANPLRLTLSRHRSR